MRFAVIVCLIAAGTAAGLGWWMWSTKDEGDEYKLLDSLRERQQEELQCSRYKLQALRLEPVIAEPLADCSARCLGVSCPDDCGRACIVMVEEKARAQVEGR